MMTDSQGTKVLVCDNGTGVGYLLLLLREWSNFSHGFLDGCFYNGQSYKMGADGWDVSDCLVSLLLRYI